MEEHKLRHRIVKNFNEKSKCAFIQLKNKDFYPSITDHILEDTIAFAKAFISINDCDLRIINHCRKSLLFSKEEVWKKKSTTSCFDVNIGIYENLRTMRHFLVINRS